MSAVRMASKLYDLEGGLDVEAKQTSPMKRRNSEDATRMQPLRLTQMMSSQLRRRHFFCPF